MAVLAAGILLLASFQPEDPVVSAAAQANVDPTLLQGALLTVGQPDPYEYLHHTGELRRPAPSSPTPSVWDRLAACESGGRWHIDAYHDGGLQFLPSTWNAYKPRGYPAYAWQATREQQIDVAVRLQAAAGWGQWPVCSRRLGLR